jgi:molybdopterin molybdotransferase
VTDFERLDADWLSVDEAVARVVDAALALRGDREEAVPLADALGRALTRDLVARATLPPFDNSAMDGYAVRGDDVRGATEDRPLRLRVTAETRAGDPPASDVGPGEAVRVMTGAPLPPGADTVVRVEDTDAEHEEAGVVVVRSDRDLGRHVRPAGQDMRRGEVAVSRGASVTPGVIAVAAALGLETLPVQPRPRVAVLSSGEELRGPGDYDDVIAGRGVPESNGPALAAAVRHAGAEPVLLGVARDHEDDIRARATAALECDALVTSGGASMGEADLFKRALLEMGLEIDFWRVKIRPGSPFSLSHLPRRDGSALPVLGLPGNPASSFVTFQILGRPFVLTLAGHARPHRRVIRASAAERLPSTPRLTHFHRVVLKQEGSTLRARLTGPQSSGLVGSLGSADGLAVVPEGLEAVEEGDPVDVMLLDDGPGAAATPGYGGGTA